MRGFYLVKVQNESGSWSRAELGERDRRKGGGRRNSSRRGMTALKYSRKLTLELNNYNCVVKAEETKVVGPPRSRGCPGAGRFSAWNLSI